MKVDETGEFGLIDALAKLLPPPPPQLLLGVGDDAAVWRTAGAPQVATTDALVQNVHFTLETATWFDVGWKAVAVNLSDIAAMGGIPRYALVTIGLPPETNVEDVLEMYHGMIAIASRFETTLAGGDTVRSPLGALVSVTLLGDTLSRPSGAEYLTRSACRPGDLICVTGSLGASAAGLRMLLSGLTLPPDDAAALRSAHLRPAPRVREGQILLSGGVRAAMDISDGLVGDLARMCAASGVGAGLWEEKVPIDSIVSRHFPAQALDLALYGGEDYELLFAAPEDIVERVDREFARCKLTPCTVVGEATAEDVGQVALVSPDGSWRPAGRGGYDHFGSGGVR